MRDVCEKGRKAGDKTEGSFAKIAASQRRWTGREVCAHTRTVRAPWSDSIAVVSADKSLWRVISMCIPSKTTNCLKTEVFFSGFFL